MLSLDVDAARRRDLRRMRTVATALLVAALAVFVLTLEADGVGGFVHAAAEAAVVGAIADWFAVTALFRRPLGLPIAHTALIPRKKDQLAVGLQEFVTENFLQPQVIRERVADADVARRIGDWLADRRHASRLVDEASEVGADLLEAMDTGDVEMLLTELAIPRLIAEPLSPALGQLLGEIVDERAHQGLVELVLAELGGWMDRHPDRLIALVTERAPAWAPDWANRLVADKLRREARAWIEDILRDDRHSARIALDHWLSELAAALQTDPQTMAAAERLKERLLTQPKAQDAAVRLIEATRDAVVTALRDESGALRRRLTDEVVRFAERLRTDRRLIERVDRLAVDAAGYAVERYGPELSTIITTTVRRWDGEQTSKRIELHVGRDLQFIRINGTVVGGLVGVVIHAVVVLFF